MWRGRSTRPRRNVSRALCCLMMNYFPALCAEWWSQKIICRHLVVWWYYSHRASLASCSPAFISWFSVYSSSFTEKNLIRSCSKYIKEKLNISSSFPNWRDRIILLPKVKVFAWLTVCQIPDRTGSAGVTEISRHLRLVIVHSRSIANKKCKNLFLICIMGDWIHNLHEYRMRNGSMSLFLLSNVNSKYACVLLWTKCDQHKFWCVTKDTKITTVELQFCFASCAHEQTFFICSCRGSTSGSLHRKQKRREETPTKQPGLWPRVRVAFVFSGRDKDFSPLMPLPSCKSEAARVKWFNWRMSCRLFLWHMRISAVAVTLGGEGASYCLITPQCLLVGRGTGRHCTRRKRVGSAGMMASAVNGENERKILHWCKNLCLITLESFWSAAVVSIQTSQDGTSDKFFTV